jgi:hypothetical protein
MRILLLPCLFFLAAFLACTTQANKPNTPSTTSFLLRNCEVSAETQTDANLADRVSLCVVGPAEAKINQDVVIDVETWATKGEVSVSSGDTWLGLIITKPDGTPVWGIGQFSQEAYGIEIPITATVKSYRFVWDQQFNCRSVPFQTACEEGPAPPGTYLIYGTFNGWLEDTTRSGELGNLKVGPVEVTITP